MNPKYHELLVNIIKYHRTKISNYMNIRYVLLYLTM